MQVNPKESNKITNKQGVCFKAGSWFVPIQEEKDYYRKLYGNTKETKVIADELERPKQIISINESYILGHNNTSIITQIGDEQIDRLFDVENYRLATPEEIKKEKIKRRFYPLTKKMI